MSHTHCELDEQFIRQAIRLAMNGRGRVEPNPMVGCVIVKDGRIIGEGYHARFGNPHAEPAALAHCTESPADATAYVTLEPCCHTNKKTPPCAPRLIEANIARVVIGCLDPNPAVNGKGVAMLRAAGIQVDAPVLEGSAKQLIAPYLAERRFARTYVTLKWAETADGKVAGTGGQRLQITDATATKLVHGLRGRSDAIVVGIGTVLADDPLLTARDVDEPRTLIRIVLDPRLRTPADSALVRTAAEFKTVLYCSDATWRSHARHRRALEARGIAVEMLHQNHDGTLSLAELSRRLLGESPRTGHRVGNTHVLVEPGPRLARSFIDSGAADRVWVFRSAVAPIHDEPAPSAVPVPAHYAKTGELDLGRDMLTEYLNPKSDCFFAAEPSADFVLASEQSRRE